MGRGKHKLLARDKSAFSIILVQRLDAVSDQVPRPLLQSAPHEEVVEAETHPGVRHHLRRQGSSHRITGWRHWSRQRDGWRDRISATPLVLGILVLDEGFCGAHDRLQHRILALLIVHVLYLPTITPVTESYERSLGELNLSSAVF